MVFLDTTILIDCLAGPRRGWHRLEAVIDREQPPAVSTLALYEWLRGDRSQEELDILRKLIPAHRIIPFTAHQARLSSDWYRSLPRARARTMDFGIAACAISHGMPLWTMNGKDFADIPGLRLFTPAL